MIQDWIQRLLINRNEIIRLEGGNEYREGSDTRDWRGKRLKGQLSARQDLSTEWVDCE
jgi:hypothetical protein